MEDVPMSHLAQHIRTRLVDGRVIATTAAERRLAMHTIFRLATDSHLLAVALVDAHLHLLARCSLAAASRLVHRIEVGLKRQLALEVGFVKYPHVPVRDARHLRYAFRYVLTQHEHHGLDIDPLREGTNLHDLLGLRLAGAYTHSSVRRWLPRTSPAQLLEWLRVRTLEPTDGPLEWLETATLSAACLIGLRGNGLEVRQARRAALEVAGARIRPHELAERLGTSERTLYRLKQQPADARLVRAIRLQLALRAQLARQSRTTDWASRECPRDISGLDPR
jgi:hypothetical protein